jgi:glycosyltransferase involved in cell wall biosynthesis
LPKLADDVVLEIVGTGPIKPFLEKRARELKVYDRVKFYENLPRRELLQKFADADAFVLLSRFEAYSLVVAEALAAETPCVVAKTSALTEWVDNKTCYGMDYPISLKQLAEKLNFAMRDRTDRQAFRKWNDAKMLDWNQITKRLEEIYDSVGR